MKQKANNFAFIDSQNLNLGIQRLGWRLDYKKLRVYLKEKYQVETAYLFIGYMPKNQALYNKLQKCGFVLIFKPVLEKKDGTVKGNVDAELVLQAMIDFDEYDQAIIVSSDGDFYCLVEHLYVKKKLRMIISPCFKTCSILLKRSAKEKIVFIDNIRKKLEYRKKVKEIKNTA
jgi:uncharacterized LabA/DUF88 family protein